MNKLFTLVFAAAVSAPVHAYKIGGDVYQMAEADNFINVGIGAETYARQDINTVYDGADIDGDVTQILKAKNVINAAIGYKATACQSINVLGQSECTGY